MGQGGSRATEVDFGEAAAQLVRARGDPAGVAARAAHVWRTGVGAGLPLRAFACAFGVRQVRALRDRRAGGAPDGASLAAYLTETAAFLSRKQEENKEEDGPEVRRGCLDALSCVLPVALEPEGAHPFADTVLFAHGSTLATRLLGGIISTIVDTSTQGSACRNAALRALLAASSECLFWSPASLFGDDRCCAGGFLDALAGVPASDATVTLVPERRTALISALLDAICEEPQQPQQSLLLPWRTDPSATAAAEGVQLATQVLLVLLAWQPCGAKTAVAETTSALLSVPGAGERVLGALARLLCAAVAGERGACFREPLLLAWLLLRGRTALLDTCLAHPALAQPLLGAALWALARGKTHRTQADLVQLCADTLLLASTRPAGLAALRAPLHGAHMARLAPVVAPLLGGRVSPGATLLDALLVQLVRVFGPAGAAPDRVRDTVLCALANAAPRQCSHRSLSMSHAATLRERPSQSCWTL